MQRGSRHDGSAREGTAHLDPYEYDLIPPSYDEDDEFWDFVNEALSEQTGAAPTASPANHSAVDGLDHDEFTDLLNVMFGPANGQILDLSYSNPMEPINLELEAMYGDPMGQFDLDFEAMYGDLDHASILGDHQNTTLPPFSATHTATATRRPSSSSTTPRRPSSSSTATRGLTSSSTATRGPSPSSTATRRSSSSSTATRRPSSSSAARMIATGAVGAARAASGFQTTGPVSSYIEKIVQNPRGDNKRLLESANHGQSVKFYVGESGNYLGLKLGNGFPVKVYSVEEMAEYPLATIVSVWLTVQRFLNDLVANGKVFGGRFIQVTANNFSTVAATAIRDAKQSPSGRKKQKSSG